MTQPERHCRKHRVRHQPHGADRLDPMMHCVLTVARHQFQSFAMPQFESWTLALPHAERLFGRDEAPRLVCGVQRAVQAMRCSRKNVFHFSNPGCARCAARLTGHERLLLNSLRSAMMERRQDAEAHAMILCEGNDTAAFLDEIGALAQVLADLQKVPWMRG